MKKILCILLSLVMLLSLAACGSKNETPAENEETEPEEEVVAEEPAVQEEEAQTASLPDGELWIELPEGYVEYNDQNGAISGAVSQMFEDTDYADMASQTQIGLYYYNADGSNINFTLSGGVEGGANDAYVAAYNQLTQEDFTKVYVDLGAKVEGKSFEHGEIDGAPAIKMVYDIELQGVAYRVYQVQALTTGGTYTWTMSDMTGEHEAEFRSVMDSAYITTEQLYEQHLAQREASAEEQEASTPTALKVTMPKGFKKSDNQNDMEIYAHKDGSMVLVKTSNFGSTSKQLMTMGIENMSADDLSAQMDAEITDFEHIKVGDVSAVTFSAKDKTAGQMYYLMAACEKNNTYAMVDVTGTHRDAFDTMVSSATVEAAEE